MNILSQAADWLQIYSGAVTAAATVFIAIFTIVLALVSRKQAVLTRESVRIAERALITTERAFVFLEDIIPDWSIRPRGGSVEFNHLLLKPRWRNSGTTPTKNMVISINWTHWPPTGNQTGVGIYDPDTPPKRMFLGPQAVEWSEAIRIPGSLATGALEGREEIIVWGRVDYDDIFEGTKSHFTEWCCKLNITSERGNVQVQTVAYTDYNRSD